MGERHFYNDKLEFEGSMDDDGYIYDRSHSCIGRVEDGTIYDSCNVPHGYIDADGQVTDMCNIPTGKEMGANFCGWGRNGSGFVRSDVLGTEHGNEYGIFLRVKDANRQYYGMGGDTEAEEQNVYEGDGYEVSDDSGSGFSDDSCSGFADDSGFGFADDSKEQADCGNVINRNEYSNNRNEYSSTELVNEVCGQVRGCLIFLVMLAGIFLIGYLFS